MACQGKTFGTWKKTPTALSAVTCAETKEERGRSDQCPQNIFLPIRTYHTAPNVLLFSNEKLYYLSDKEMGKRDEGVSPFSHDRITGTARRVYFPTVNKP